MGKLVSKRKPTAASTTGSCRASSRKARYARVRRWIEERLEAVRSATPEQLAADKAEWEKLAQSMNADRERAKSRRAF